MILVEKGQCPLDKIAELGESTSVAWILIGSKAIQVLERTCDKLVYLINDGSERLTFKATDDSPETSIVITRGPIYPWYFVKKIQAPDIRFTEAVEDQQCLYLLEMEE